MDTEFQSEHEHVDETEHNPLIEATRKILAAIGAIALSKDEMENFIDKLVERGEIAEQDGRKLMNEILEKRKHATRSIDEKTNKRVQEILERLNIPTKRDIDELSDKVATLAKKIEEMTKQ